MEKTKNFNLEKVLPEQS